VSEENASHKEAAMSDGNGMDEEVAASEENATNEENAVATPDSLPPKASNWLEILLSFLLLPLP